MPPEDDTTASAPVVSAADEVAPRTGRDDAAGEQGRSSGHELRELACRRSTAETTGGTQPLSTSEADTVATAGAKPPSNASMEDGIGGGDEARVGKLGEDLPEEGYAVNGGFHCGGGCGCGCGSGNAGLEPSCSPSPVSTASTPTSSAEPRASAVAASVDESGRLHGCGVADGSAEAKPPAITARAAWRPLVNGAGDEDWDGEREPCREVCFDACQEKPCRESREACRETVRELTSRADDVPKPA